jgi:hypothetical protein
MKKPTETKLNPVKTDQIKIYVEDDVLYTQGVLEAEIPLPLDKESYLAFSDGTVLNIRHKIEEVCRIDLEHKGSALFSRVPAEDGDDLESDLIRLDGKFEWCVLGEDITTTRIFT